METRTETLNIETQNGIIECHKKNNELISVNIGQPKIAWDEIPLSKEVSTLNLPIEGEPTGTNFGNPHCSFFVDDLNKIDVRRKGPTVEIFGLFGVFCLSLLLCVLSRFFVLVFCVCFVFLLLCFLVVFFCLFFCFVLFVLFFFLLFFVFLKFFSGVDLTPAP